MEKPLRSRLPLSSSQNCEIGSFVKQNTNSQENFEGINALMCNSYKIKSLLHKLPLNHAAGKHGIFAEHIFFAGCVWAQ